jgi:molecular chaperone GrpE (heat shock protein)
MAESLQKDAADSAAGDGAPPLERIAAVLAAVRSELAQANERAAARERIIDRLHEENQRLRAGERQLLLRPVMVDLSRLRNDLLRQAATLPEDTVRAQVVTLLESFACSVEQALERCGVYPICPAPGAEFDPRQHLAMDTVPARDGERDGQVAQVLADGYRDSVTGRVLTPAQVKVARWIPPTQPEQQASGNDRSTGGGVPEQATPNRTAPDQPTSPDQPISGRPTHLGWSSPGSG